MNKTAGIKGISSFDFGLIGEIKQTVLLFDTVGIPKLDSAFSFIRQRHEPGCMHSKVIDELEYLKERGIIFDSMKSNSTTLKDDADHGAIEKEFKKLNQIITNPPSTKIGMDAAVRLSCLMLNNDKENVDFNAVPLLTGANLGSEEKATRTDVINLIIEKMPIPDETTPWDNIFEFKSNPDNIGRFAGLRTWVNKAVRSGNSINEISDELDYLLYTYKKNLDIHKIKHNNGIIQSLVIGAADFSENFAKLKFSEIAKGLFSASQSHVDILKAEISSTGHDLAYIYQANRKFSDDKCF